MAFGKKKCKPMRKFVLAIIIILGSFSTSCYQKKMVVPHRTDQRRLDEPRADLRPLDQRLLDERRPDEHRLDVESGAVTDATNIHYTGKYCTECHEKTPQNGNKFLKYGEDYKQLCRCHYKTTKRDIHPADIEPPKEIKKRVPNDFPLRNGEIACITCHDIFAQCKDIKTNDTFTRGQNFLRGGPYKKLTTLCFKCHDKTKFEKFNPHKQLNAKKEIVELKCLYCHKKVPDVKTEEFKDVTLIGDLGPLCVRCHNKATKGTLHANHLRKPSAKVLARIKQMELELGISLPLSDEGKITCATCHNPHQKGVIPAERVGAKGAGEVHKHRLSGNMCIKCHQM